MLRRSKQKSYPALPCPITKELKTNCPIGRSLVFMISRIEEAPSMSPFWQYAVKSLWYVTCDHENGYKETKKSYAMSYSVWFNSF